MSSYATAWAMFVLQETDRLEMADELWAGFEGDDAELVRSMTLVAAVLRKVVRDHAEKVGCDCGSDHWLEEELLRAHEYEEADE
jgi:hypothetical protein